MAKSKHTSPAKGFTSKYLDNLPPATRDDPSGRYEVADNACSGLRLRVTTKGRKTFVYYPGKGLVTFGLYGVGRGEGIAKGPSCITLEQARAALRVAKARHQAGVAPNAEEPPKDFRDLTERLYEGYAKVHRKRPEEFWQVAEHDILPVLGNRELNAALGPLDGRAVITKVVGRGATNHAGKVLRILKQIGRYGVSNGWLDRNPFESLDARHLGVVNNHRKRFLEAEEIKLLWRALDTAPRLSEQVRLGLKLLLLTGVRTGELLQARWEHISETEWTIPEENTKTGAAWVVPLVPQTRALFGELKDIAEELDSPWVLPGSKPKPGNEPSEHLSDKALARAVRRLLALEINGERILPVDPFVPHDLRRTVRTHLSKLKVPPHIAEKCLNHSLGPMEKVYDHNPFIPERREALQKWSDQVDLFVTERGNVAVLHG
jgi:integrase